MYSLSLWKKTANLTSPWLCIYANKMHKALNNAFVEKMLFDLILLFLLNMCIVFMVRFLCVSVCFVSSGANLPVQLDCLSPRMSVGTVSRILPQLQSGVTKMAMTSRLCCQPFLCQHLWNHTRSHCIIPSVHALSVRRESSQNLHTCTSLQITPVKSQRIMMCSQKLLHSVLKDRGCVLSRSLIPLNRNLSQSQLLCNKYEPPNTMQSNVHNFGSALKHARNFPNHYSVHGRDNFERTWYHFSAHNRCIFSCYDFKRFGYHSSTWKCYGRRLYGTAATNETGDPLSPDSAPFKCYIEHLRKEHQAISDTLQVCFQPPNLLCLLTNSSTDNYYRVRLCLTFEAKISAFKRG